MKVPSKERMTSANIDSLQYARHDFNCFHTLYHLTHITSIFKKHRYNPHVTGMDRSVHYLLTSYAPITNVLGFESGHLSLKAYSLNQEPYHFKYNL